MPNNNVQFMVTNQTWSNESTELKNERFMQLHQSNFGSIAVNKTTTSVLIMNPTDDVQPVVFTMQNAMTTTVSAAAIVLASAYLF
jgi:hypothetical protein